MYYINNTLLALLLHYNCSTIQTELRRSQRESSEKGHRYPQGPHEGHEMTPEKRYGPCYIRTKYARERRKLLLLLLCFLFLVSVQSTF